MKYKTYPVVYKDFKADQEKFRKWYEQCVSILPDFISPSLSKLIDRINKKQKI